MTTGHDSDLQTHQEMWQTFVRIIGYSASAVMALLALMALFLL